MGEEGKEEREGEREEGGWRGGGGKGGKDRKKIHVMLMLYKLALSLWSPPPPPPNNAYSSFKVKQVASRNIFLFTIPQKIGHIKQAIKFELP